MSVVVTDQKNHFWDQAECLPREALQAIQLQRLRELVRRIGHVPFYRDALAKANITADDVRSLEDVRRLPMTTKADLRDHYPLGFLAVPREQVARIHGSSGTTGKPTFVCYTKNDMELWANLCARFLTAGGLRPEHTVQIAFGYGLFTGGFGLHQGVEKVGAAVVPASAGNTQRQLLLIADLGVQVLVCTPSYALNIAESARAMGINPRDLPLQYGHFGGEPWTEQTRLRIESELGIKAFNNYGLSEIIGPGVSGDCECRCGMHLQEDHFLIECIDPWSMKPVPDGVEGELVITTLTREAMPVLRYRTRDIAALNHQVCACGRTTVRMSRVRGRSDDMFIIRGVNVYPSQIEEALLRIEQVAPHFLVEIDRPGNLDMVVVKVEVRPEAFSDEMRKMQALHDRIDHEIHAVTGVRMGIELVKPQSLTRFEGKAKRVVDHRREKGII